MDDDLWLSAEGGLCAPAALSIPCGVVKTVNGKIGLQEQSAAQGLQAGSCHMLTIICSRLHCCSWTRGDLTHVTRPSGGQCVTPPSTPFLSPPVLIPLYLVYDQLCPVIALGPAAMQTFGAFGAAARAFGTFGATARSFRTFGATARAFGTSGANVRAWQSLHKLMKLLQELL